ncbi:lytic transglycosylase domain-containing protein [Paraburkholderia sp. HD33-4]|uniref:lytic transglycosylase domain-containing protein n=1 Tax=Paraburkholderia sp. HD33-4 TaxID=2883242 RepID=UPI001F357944|nr:lytic transglycosylase domain-containing protein [Paraburkholderia sp. HD33-4]
MDDLLATLSQATGAQMPQSAAPSGPGAFDPSKSYGTPSQMLDNLANQESSGGKNLVNKQTGAMGPYQFLPQTIADLRQQGVKFDPFDPQQSRAAADWYLQKLKAQNGGSYDGALKAYGGFVHADPSQYINHVENGVPGFSGGPAPTTPGQSYSGQQAPADSGPKSDLLDTLQSAMSGAPAAPAAKPVQPTAAPQQAETPLQQFGHAAAGLADTALSLPGQIAQQGTYALARASGMSPEEAQAQAAHFGGAIHPVGNAFGVTNTLGYQGEASQRAMQAVGGAVGQGVNAVANATGLPQQDVANMAQSAAMLVPGAAHLAAPLARGIANEVGYAADAAAAGVRKVGGAVADAGRAAGQTASDFGNAIGTVTGLKAPEAPALTNAPMPVPGRPSVGAAGTSFAQQAADEGVPSPIVQKIAAAEKSGELNPTAAERHIEAGSLPVPIELTAGQASGDVNLLSSEMNSRGRNPELANRFNAQNGQIADNLSAIRDQVSPNVNVPSGAPTGQALVDAYKEMDAPIQQQISELYAKARDNNGAPALVDAAPQMKDFAAQIGPTRFNALPANVQQIFRDASANQVALPPGFEVNGSSVRPMNVGDLMDIDKTLSGALKSATDGSVRHDIGALRDSIVNSQLDPSAAGADAFAAYKTAQASARARFQAMDADPAYKAAVNDIAPAGEPSALADDFARKYIAGGKTSNVQNMMQNLSNDPANRELVASALMDHVRQQAGVDLRTGSGNISQAGLNKALVNLGDKTRIVLGPQASQTLEKLGNVARYTQEQPRGSYVNNSNTFVASAASAAKSAAEGVANRAAFGVPIGTWTRQALERRAGEKAVSRSLEPGAGVGVPLNSLIRNRGTQ